MEPKQIREYLSDVIVLMDWPDLLLLLYLTAAARQYFWGVENLYLAWTFSGLAALTITLVHIKKRERDEGRSGLPFLLIVALPLLLIFALRLPFPDLNFDQMNYHLVNTERALKGWPFQSGDFFPGVLQVNPMADMVAGISRFFLGYRLGTIINLFAVLWAATVIDRILRDYLKNAWGRCVALCFVISTEHLLFLLNLYMIDLLALPLLFEALHLAMKIEKAKNKQYTMLQMALFLGLATSFKLMNLAFAIPVIGLAVYNLYSIKATVGLKSIAISLGVFILPHMPFALFMYLQTGNPIFPYYNNLFRSPYFPPQAYRDPSHGPLSLFETVFWPIWGFTEPNRISAMAQCYLYKGRISIAFLVAIIGCLARKVDSRVRRLSLFTFAAIMLWSFTSGDIRYGIPMEICGGLIIITFAITAYEAELPKLTKSLTAKLALAAILFGGLLLFQTVLIYNHAIVHEEFYSSDSPFDTVSQPTLITAPNAYLREARNILHDQKPEDFLDAETRNLFAPVEVWINSYDATSGIEVTARPDIPMVSVCKFINLFDYMDSEASRALLARTLEAHRGKRMYSLVPPPHLEDALKFMSRAGLHADRITPFEMPFYSKDRKLKLLLIAVSYGS